MKKLLALFIVLVMMLGVLASCSGGRLPKNMDGKTASQIILANERLNSQLLKNEGNIFETGTAVFENLAKIAEENLVKYEKGEITHASAMSDSTSKTYELDDGSKVVVQNGTSFEWSGFNEYSNSYDYFESTTENITTSAERGSELIDRIKKNVRVVDKWVKDGGEEYYLHVDENYELLFERRDGDDGVIQLDACRRYKDENGNNVYEVYIASGDDSSEQKNRDYMLYIPGLRFEFSTRMTMPGTDYYYDTNFIADNSKGYWEMVNIGYTPSYDTYNVSYTALKDDVCYDSMCDPFENDIIDIQIISANRKTDIVSIREGSSGMNAEISLGAFNGIEKLTYSTTSDKISSEPQNGDVWFQPNEEDPHASIYTQVPVNVITKNGTSFTIGDTFIDDKLGINYVLVHSQSMGTAQGGYRSAYVGSVQITIDCDGTFSEQMDILAEFLRQAGLECRYDLDYVEAGTVRAKEEIESFMRYYKWNGYFINNKEDMARAYDIETQKVLRSETFYDEIKDAEVISRSLISVKDMYFGEIATLTEGGKYAYRKVEIPSIEVSTDDTLLFVEGEPYVIKLALIGSDGLLVHLDYEGATEKTFAKADSFKIEQGDVKLMLPEELSLGKYTLVAYISTSDGIRSSAFKEVTLDDIQTDTLVSGNLQLKTSSDNGKLILEYTENETINISVEAQGKLTYNELYELIAGKAYEYGAIIKTDALIESHNALENRWTALSTDAVEIGGGMYRLAYENKNADKVVEGAIIAVVSIPE